MANGLLAASQLVETSAGKLLHADAAHAYERLNALYRRERGSHLAITEGYRSLATQQTYWLRSLQRVRHQGVMTERRRLPYGHPQRFVASRPGTSVHGLGFAADYAQLGGFSGSGYAWMEDNARSCGWYQPQQYRKGGKYPEPWHWEYERAYDLAPRRVGSTITLPTAPTLPGVGVKPEPIPQEAIMASLEELRDELQPVIDRLDAEHDARALYRLHGGTAAWLTHPGGIGREHVTGERYARLRQPRILDVGALSPLWRLPILGSSVGELYRRPLDVDPSGAAYIIEGGMPRHVERAEYEQLSSVSPVPITTLDAEHELWRLVAGR